MGKKSTVKLTRKFISDIKVPADRDRVIVFDCRVRGFGMAKYHSGKVSFFVEVKTASGKRRRRNIASSHSVYDVSSVSQIRDRAENIILSVKSAQL